MKKPSRFIRVLGAASLVASLLVGAFGAATVSAQGDAFSPVAGEYGVFFPWVANDDESTGLGPADTSVTIQNLWNDEVIVGAYVGVGNDSLPGDNGWELINPFVLETLASKTFSAAQLGIAEGEGAPVAFFGLMLHQVNGDLDCEGANSNWGEGQYQDLLDQYDLNEDGDLCDYETYADDDVLNGGNSWNYGSDGVDEFPLVQWEDGECIVMDFDNTDSDDYNGQPLKVFTPGAGHVEDGNGEPDLVGANLDLQPDQCTYSESEAAGIGVVEWVNSPIGGVAKQAVDGENLPYTSDVDTAVSGYNGLAGQELVEMGNTEDDHHGWYFPIIQTNGGPGGTWNSIIRVANFGDGGGTIGAAGVNITFYPYDDAAGELNQSFVRTATVNAGQTWNLDVSSFVPEGWIGSAHISADAPVFAMVDRVKVGYNMWITNTATNAHFTAHDTGEFGVGSSDYVLFAPDVRKDFYGWNTGIAVANISDTDTDVTIQYYGDIGTAAQTREIHDFGMTFFYDPSQAPQDNNQQDPTMDPNANSGEIGAAIIFADDPIAAVVDMTKYPESTSSNDANVYQALSYSATNNLYFGQAVPLVQRGNPSTGMGDTSGIQIFNPSDFSTPVEVEWVNSAGDFVGNDVDVVVNGNSMTFVYSMNDAQLPNGFLGSAVVHACEGASVAQIGFCSPVSVISTMVNYEVQYDGSAVWNGYNPQGTYRTLVPWLGLGFDD